MGAAGIADFNAFADPSSSSFDPQFKATWDSIEAHINTEASITGQISGAAGGALSPILDQAGNVVSPVLDQAGNVINSGSAALQGTIDQAKVAFANSFDQILSDPNMSYAVNAASNLYDTAKQYVMVGQTIAGSIMTIAEVVEHASGGVNSLATFQSFTGAMIGALGTVGALTGIATAGIGAVITGLVSVGVDLLRSAIGSPPPGPANGYSFCVNFELKQKPDWTVGGLGVWGPSNAPSTPGWRAFPDPNSTNDATWFAHQAGAGWWQKAYFGWGGPDNSTGYDYTSEYSAWGDDRPSNGLFAKAQLLHTYGGEGPPLDRPIDNAFPSCDPEGVWSVFPSSMYSAVCESAAGFTLVPGLPNDVRGKLAQAFIGAWKANAAFALNGLQPQKDWKVLVQLLRFWNKSHQGPMVAIPSINVTGATGVGAYLGNLVAQAMRSGVPDLLFGSGLGVNTGAQHNVAPLGAAIYAPSFADTTTGNLTQVTVATLVCAAMN